MMSKLEALLHEIHPARTLRETNRRLDEAMNAFDGRSPQITDWGGFRACMVRFLHHVETHLLRMRQACPGGLALDWGRSSRLLERAYGASGAKAAFEMARTGSEGGLYAVLKRMGALMADEYARNEISARVHAYWNGLSLDEKLAAPGEYLDAYGRILPWELTEGSAARLRANFVKALEEHPRLLERLGRLGPT